MYQEWSDSMPPVLVDGNLCNFTIRLTDDQTNATLAAAIYKQYIADPTGTIKNNKKTLFVI